MCQQQLQRPAGAFVLAVQQDGGQLANTVSLCVPGDFGRHWRICVAENAQTNWCALSALLRHRRRSETLAVILRRPC